MCRRYTAHFTAFGAAFETAVTAPGFVGRWCRRYAAPFTAVDAAFETTARVTSPSFVGR